jgi:hypothetical protein
MKDVERAAGQVGQFRGAMHRRCFQLRRPGVGVPDRRDMALGQRVGAQHVEQRPGLAVEHGAPARLAHGAERAQQRHVVEDHAGVSLVHLESGAAGSDHRGNFGQPFHRRAVPGGHGHVQAIVDGHLAVGLRPALGQRLQHRLAGLRLDKVDHRRRAAECSRKRAVAKVVGAHHASQRHLQMHVGVDGAWNHIAAGSVDGLIAGQVLTYGDDPFTGYGNVGAAAAIRPNDHPPLDNQYLVSHR